MQAKLAAAVSMVVGFSLQAAGGIAIGASQGQVIRIFTSDPEVLAVVRDIAYYAMAFQVR